MYANGPDNPVRLVDDVIQAWRWRIASAENRTQALQKRYDDLLAVHDKCLAEIGRLREEHGRDAKLADEGHMAKPKPKTHTSPPNPPPSGPALRSLGATKSEVEHALAEHDPRFATVLTTLFTAIRVINGRSKDPGHRRRDFVHLEKGLAEVVEGLGMDDYIELEMGPGMDEHGGEQETGEAAAGVGR
jgi:hypothetical protein